MSNSIDELKRENQRLQALLERHGINWRKQSDESIKGQASQSLSTIEKVDLFRSLFRGRSDVHALRWENAKGDRSGYSPACANEWRSGVCEKPRIKCSDCKHRQLVPLSSEVVYKHLSGDLTVGSYPLLENNTCWYLAVDFDKDNWREDVKAFTATCKSFDLPAHIEISRSGQGAHVWIFFSQAIPAHQARLLGSSLISHTCATNHQLDLSSYDRLFPNQDKLPNGGFGNLIALPLQKQSREQGGTVFVDHELNPIEDQWEYLASVEKVSTLALDTIIEQLSDTGHSLDVSFIDQEDLQKPWKRATKDDLSRVDNLPETLELTLSDKLYIRKDTLPQPLRNRLIRLAAFQNPEFYKAQAMRFQFGGKPRVIGCAENYPFHIALPRGCLDAVVELLESLAIKTTLSDERNKGTTINVSFNGKLYSGQRRAVDAMLMHDTGILYAPTAFGKTVAAAAIVSERQVNTLIVGSPR